MDGSTWGHKHGLDAQIHWREKWAKNQAENWIHKEWDKDGGNADQVTWGHLEGSRANAKWHEDWTTRKNGNHFSLRFQDDGFGNTETRQEERKENE